jgi:hypothetical protein
MSSRRVRSRSLTRKRNASLSLSPDPYMTNATSCGRPRTAPST